MGKTDVDTDELRRRALARYAANVKRAEHDLGTFIELHNPEYDRPEHLAPLLDALDRSMREPVFALVEAPPQHGKTDSCLAHIARLLRYRPRSDVAYCSYAASLALRKSRRCRDMAHTAGVWMTDEVVKRKSRFDTASAVSYWQTIDGGSFTAGGRSGGFTGGGYDFVLGDDLLKDRAEAESSIMQEKAIEVVRSTFLNRVRPQGSLFVTHQPWNQHDPIAQLKREKAGPDGQSWEVISLPAIRDAVYDDDGHLIGGTPLWPARYSLEWYAKTKHRVKDYNWFSQYTLERRPRGTTLFREPGRYTAPTIDHAIVLISCDPGIEEGPGGRLKVPDSSGIVAATCYLRAGKYHTPEHPALEVQLDLLHVEDRWCEPGDLLDELDRLQHEEFPGAMIVIETVGAFKMLVSIAARTHPRLRLTGITPKTSKYLRARPAAAAWNEGRIRVPLDAPWVADFLDEARRFTGKAGGKDNRVDALTQLYDYAGQALVSWDTEGEDEVEERMMPASPY